MTKTQEEGLKKIREANNVLWMELVKVSAPWVQEASYIELKKLSYAIRRTAIKISNPLTTNADVLLLIDRLELLRAYSNKWWMDLLRSACQRDCYQVQDIFKQVLQEDEKILKSINKTRKTRPRSKK